MFIHVDSQGSQFYSEILLLEAYDECKKIMMGPHAENKWLLNAQYIHIILPTSRSCTKVFLERLWDAENRVKCY